MSRAAAEACTQQLAAGCGTGIGLQQQQLLRAECGTRALAVVQPAECE